MPKTIFILLVVCSLSTLSFVMKNDGTAGRTGSPGETTCNTSGCHTGNVLNSPTGSIVISAPTLINWQYIPGTVYPISVTVTRSGNSKFGIGFEALQTSGANGGTLTITHSTQSQLKSVLVAGNTRTNVVHKTNGGLGSGSFTFNFNWTAPITNVGNITFYAAGNAANAMNNTSGDFIFTTSQVLTPTAVGINENQNVISGLQVYPNPVTNYVQVKFTTNKPVEIEVRVLNLIGKTVEVLRNEKLNPGTHTLENSISNNLTNGIYLLQVVAENEITSSKIVLIR